jgi:uncharacterized metal-binding protein
MPDYKTHQRINSTVLLLVNASALAWYKTAIPFDYVVFTVAFILSSWILTPDLDTKSTPYYRWKGFKLIWDLFHGVSKHRGILHNPILSPMILCGPIYLIHYECNISIEFTWIYAGITAQVWIHIIADWYVSRKKERE